MELQMAHRIRQLCILLTLLVTPLSSIMLPTFAQAKTLPMSHNVPAALIDGDLPAIDPNYVYDQLFFMATHFQHREAGYDSNPAITSNGHEAFATYWSQELSRDLQGFAPQIRRDPFAVTGWTGRPATTQAFNVEGSVAGATHPEQVVVIGCHYDGEALSTQSANDDASGCAIELAVAKAMGAYWRSHRSYPARTLRFVLFDAEEQGLFGSFHYLNSTINGDTANIVAMFNEEQNGIAYPLRYLGQAANPLLPFYIELSPLQKSRLYSTQEQLSPRQRAGITHFRALMQQAIPAVFQQFLALGYQTLTYHVLGNADQPQPIFTPGQLNTIQPEDDQLGGSDQIPFTLAGLPCATFVGNSTYYGANNQPAYPYDQPQDTIQLMNTYADGSSQKSNALMLALALPGMLTTWMLHQPDILGDTGDGVNGVPSRQPTAAISDIGITQVGQAIALDATNTLLAAGDSSAPSYSWDFGDGTQANGVMVHHSYQKTGAYTLTLHLHSATGQRAISKQITVVTTPTQYANPYQAYKATGKPPANTIITLPTANDALSDKVGIVSASTGVTPNAGNPKRANTSATARTPLSLVGYIVGIIILIAGASSAFFVIRRRSIKKGKAM